MKHEDLIRRLESTIQQLMADAGGEPKDNDVDSAATWAEATENLRLTAVHLAEVQTPSFRIDCVEPQIAQKQLKEIGVTTLTSFESSEVHVFMPQDQEPFTSLLNWLDSAGFDLEDIFTVGA